VGFLGPLSKSIFSCEILKSIPWENRCPDQLLSHPARWLLLQTPGSRRHRDPGAGAAMVLALWPPKPGGRGRWTWCGSSCKCSRERAGEGAEAAACPSLPRQASRQRACAGGEQATAAAGESRRRGRLCGTCPETRHRVTAAHVLRI